MRYLLSGLFLGIVLGALVPAGTVFGTTTCANLTNTHSSLYTCCSSCDRDDYNVDNIKNNGDTYAVLCILVENSANVSAIQYIPTQCQNHDPGVSLGYTVGTDRTTPANEASYRTDVVLGTQCDSSSTVPTATQHHHVFSDGC